MAPIESTIEIARPPDEVFAYLADPTRFAEWQHDVVRVDLAGGRPPGLGRGSPPPGGLAASSGA